ncbi:MAG: excinuclease ABC subunit A, partial [Pseudomonadota bacterium]|nr:excinuclease ABC subunit A [Pseudomonadota bacterium]
RTPFSELSDSVRWAVLHGSGQDEITMAYDDGLRTYSTTKQFEGVVPNMERRWRETDSSWVREELEKYQSIHPCDRCDGNRLKPEALAVKIGTLHIAEVSRMSILEAKNWFAALPSVLNATQTQIGERILKEINERLGFLVDVGLEYLTLNRSSGTLSGGESQRIRLASQIGSGLMGVLYVLDEPSIGLHSRDNARLLDTLRRLRDLGNTVVVVEHDEEAIKTADYLVDLGPGAGVHGGHIVARGTPDEVMAAPESLTGQYLTQMRQIPIPAERRKGHKKQILSVKGARANNLKDIDVDIPLGTFTCVSGVSGSGKSTFVIETLYHALARRLHGTRVVPGEYD